MGNSLTDTNISATYKSLLKTNVTTDTDGVSAVLASVDSGVGTASALSISTTQVLIKGASTTLFDVEDGSDNSFITIDSSSTPKTITLNKEKVNCDLTVSGDDNTNLLQVDGSTDRIGINVAAPLAKLDITEEGEQLRLSFNVDSYASFEVDTSSNLTITCAESGIINLADSTTLASSKDLTLTSGNLIMGSLTNGLQINGSNTIAQLNTIDATVDLNATAGVITCLTQTMTEGAEAEFTFTNSTIETDSVILLTVQCAQNVANGTYVAEIVSIGTGTCNIRLSNPNADATQAGISPIIHFLIIKTG